MNREIQKAIYTLELAHIEGSVSREKIDQLRQEIEKSWSGDLQKKYPDGGWRTINGARVFINAGKVIAGLDGFNQEIDKFFSEKKESKPKAAPKKDVKTPKEDYEMTRSEFAENKWQKKVDTQKRIMEQFGEDKGFVDDANTSIKKLIDNKEKIKEDILNDREGYEGYIKRMAASGYKVPENVLAELKESPKKEAKDSSKKETSKPITLDTFKDLAKNSKNVDEFVNKINEVKNVPSEVSTEFFEKYGDDGKLSPKKAAENMFNETKDKNKTADTPKKGKQGHTISTKTETFKIKQTDGDKEAKGKSVTIENYGDLELFVHKNEKGVYTITEKRSGLGIPIADAKNEKDAVDDFYNILLWQQSYNDNYKSIYALVNENIDRIGSIDGAEKYKTDKAFVPSDEEKLKIVEEKYKQEKEKESKVRRDSSEKNWYAMTLPAHEKRINELRNRINPNNKQSEKPITDKDVKTSIPDFDFSKVSKEERDSIDEKAGYIVSEAKDILESFERESGTGDAARKANKWTKDVVKEYKGTGIEKVIEGALESGKNPVEVASIISESKVLENYDLGDYTKEFKESLSSIKEKYPDAVVVKNPNQTRLFKAETDPIITKSIYHYESEYIQGNIDKETRDSIREIVKGFSSDLQSKFPNGGWKTINGAKVFINDGKVVAGLDGFNKEIDKFFSEKKSENESKKKESKEKPNKGDRITDTRKDKTGTIAKISKPSKGSALEGEPYVMSITYDDGTKAMNMPMDDRYSLETKSSEPPKKDVISKLNDIKEKVKEFNKLENEGFSRWDLSEKVEEKFPKEYKEIQKKFGEDSKDVRQKNYDKVFDKLASQAFPKEQAKVKRKEQLEKELQNEVEKYGLLTSSNFWGSLPEDIDRIKEAMTSIKDDSFANKEFSKVSEENLKIAIESLNTSLTSSFGMAKDARDKFAPEYIDYLKTVKEKAENFLKTREKKTADTPKKETPKSIKDFASKSGEGISSKILNNYPTLEIPENGLVDNINKDINAKKISDFLKNVVATVKSEEDFKSYFKNIGGFWLYMQKKNDVSVDTIDSFLNNINKIEKLETKNRKYFDSDAFFNKFNKSENTDKISKSEYLTALSNITGE